MADYIVDLPEGGQARVSILPVLKLKRPMSDDEAFRAIHRFVAKRAATQVLPLVKPRPASTELLRNEQGQLARAITLPAATADEVAAEIGRAVADRYLSEIER